MIRRDRAGTSDTKQALLIARALVASCLGACTSQAPEADQGFPETPLSVVQSATGAVELEVRTSPDQPPVRGSSRVELTLRDASGLLSGVSIQAVPWMPAMGHGSPTEPTVSPLEEGKYLLSAVELYMPGRWELRLELGGSVTDSAIVGMDVR